jgi:hypothetical protein
VTNPLYIVAFSLCLASVACEDANPTSPSAPPGPIGITFGGLNADGVSFSGHSESGLSVSVASGDWSIRTSYGNPAPFVQFWAPPGTVVGGEVRVTRARSVFRFASVDVYSSTTPVPYTITGLRRGATIFAFSDTQANTRGNFATVVNPHATDFIDTLVIALTNPAAPCCRNPVGLDNIVVR